MKRAFFQLHTAVFLAGFTGILGRLITLNEGILVWYRLLFTAITLWILYFFQKKIHRIAFRDVLALIGVGAVASLHWVTFYGSIKYANVSVALVCFSSIGFFTAILEPVIIGKKFSLVELLLGMIAIIGIFLIFHFDPAYKTGIIIGIISAVLGSLFPVLNRRLLQRLEPETVILHMVSGGLLFFSALLPFYLQRFPPTHFIPTLSDFFWLLVLSWVCSVWAFQLSMNALKSISAFTVNLTYNLEPLYGIALAFLLYQENKLLRDAFYAGLALIVLSVFLQTMLVYRRHRRRGKLIAEW